MSELTMLDVGQQKQNSKGSVPGAPSSEVFASTAAAKPLSGKRFLIVDDDAVFLFATANKIKRAGGEVWTAREGAEAIAAMRSRTVDAVLMDVDFPVDVFSGGVGSWNGIQLVKWLRQLPTSGATRFIVVSGSDSPANRLQAKEVGATSYLLKPLNPDELVAAVS
jgi:two-component system chemotaxis response regulator CheY